LLLPTPSHRVSLLYTFFLLFTAEMLIVFTPG
jgi:hypothetical protein